MSNIDEEVYSKIFNALRHGVRRRILSMLSEKQMTFTAINENLGISSSHLTYHIDSLGELLSKNDSNYRLSVFGRAAVEMMNNVENPPNQIDIMKRQNILRVTAGLLIIAVVAISALSINLYNLSSRHRELNTAYEALLDELEVAVSKLRREETASNIIFRYGSSSGKHPNELDTFKGIFTKDMVNKPPVTINLDFTQEEIDTIHRKIVEINFFSYPTTYQPKLEEGIQSSSSSFTVYSIEYHNETGRKFVYWTSQYTHSEDTQYQNLMELATLIIETIQSKPEYQDLPEPTAGYA